MQLATVKADLRVIHNDDDVLLQNCMRSAIDESLQFCNLAAFELDSDGEESFDVQSAVLLLVRAMYEQVEPEKISEYRRAAEAKLMPYRVLVGV